MTASLPYFIEYNSYVSVATKKLKGCPQTRPTASYGPDPDQRARGPATAETLKGPSTAGPMQQMLYTGDY